MNNKFIEQIQKCLDNGSDVVLSTNNNGYVAIVHHDKDDLFKSITLMEYNENTDTFGQVNILPHTLKKYL